MIVSGFGTFNFGTKTVFIFVDSSWNRDNLFCLQPSEILEFKLFFKETDEFTRGKDMVIHRFEQCLFI
jgi:hypothetical protein